MSDSTTTTTPTELPVIPGFSPGAPAVPTLRVDFNPNMPVSSLNWQAIPATSEKLYRFPGGAPFPDNVVTGNQFAMVIRHLVECSQDPSDKDIRPTTSYAEACRVLRVRANIRGNSRDYDLPKYVMRKLGERRADEPLTDKQVNTRDTMIECLNGRAVHWDAGIAAAIAATPKPVCDEVLVAWVRVTNQRTFDYAYNTSQRLFGAPARRELLDRDEVNADDLPVIGDPVTGDEEPF